MSSMFASKLANIQPEERARIYLNLMMNRACNQWCAEYPPYKDGPGHSMLITVVGCLRQQEMHLIKDRGVPMPFLSSPTMRLVATKVMLDILSKRAEATA